jgi:hypothetical protein
MTVLLALFLAAAPDWVSTLGRTPRFPIERYASGFALSDGSSDPLAAAKTEASSELARSLSVRIESQMTDAMEVSGNKERQEIHALSKASTDVHLNGVTFETWLDGKRAYALAILDRAQAATAAEHERETALTQAQALLATGGKGAEALRDCLSARTALSEALRQESQRRAILRGGAPDAAALDARFAALQTQASERISTLLKKPQGNLSEASEALAFQLAQQGVGKSAHWLIAPFTYRDTIYPSPFGRSAAQELERAAGSSDAAGTVAGDVVLKGTFVDEAEIVRLLLVAQKASDGRTLASAQASLPRASIPKELLLAPANLESALREQKILGASELIPGGLKVELFTNKQASSGASQIFFAKDELKLFVRVNKACWVRLVYLLQNGRKAPIAQAWFIDEGKINQLVEYPDSFEIAPPYGAEHIQAAAFTEKPEPLPTHKETLDGTEYDVVADDTSALVKHRGFARKSKAETADTFVTITSMAAK